MEEEIKRVKRFENLEGAIKVYKEFRRFKNDGWIESIDPDYFFNLVDYILANSIPTSVIQNTLEDINEKIEEFTRNIVATKEEIEQEYWKSELNKAIAKRNILQEILEKGNK